MFLSSGTSYYSVPLTNLIITCKSEQKIHSPNIMFDLLSYSDLNKIEMMMSSNMDLEDIYEEICNKCIRGIMHFPNEAIDYDASPAGVVTHLGQKILHHSRQTCEHIQETFAVFSENVTLIDQLTAFVSRYTCTPIKEVREYPVDRIVREYSILQAAFPSELQPIVIEEEKVSRVGG